MQEKYSRIPFPDKRYRELLGSALCAFNYNNSFLIEVVIKYGIDSNWYDLQDLHSETKDKLDAFIKDKFSNALYNFYKDICQERNRIIHSFQITHSFYDQIMATKTKKTHKQFIISKKCLLDFIFKNDEFAEYIECYRQQLNRDTDNV